jgi:chemotaxis protein methyltransferase CheR
MIRWFEQEGESWRVKRDLARRIRFKRQSLLQDQPIPGRFDVILCRNVLLYFSAERRRAAFARLADATASDGYLLLGAGETVIGQTKRLAADRSCRGLYRLAGEPTADRREPRVANRA